MTESVGFTAATAASLRSAARSSGSLRDDRLAAEVPQMPRPTAAGILLLSTKDRAALVDKRGTRLLSERATSPIQRFIIVCKKTGSRETYVQMYPGKQAPLDNPRFLVSRQRPGKELQQEKAAMSSKPD
ncbi:hypothetical protein C8J56DRAFT_890166 [Mycena floridula]|nr:hypothetical protein C8J56DRAFT_890166 [Mycena floridula]